MIKSLLVSIVAALLVIACADQPTKETLGTGAGAVVGGVIGSEVGSGTASTIIGGVLGAALGRELGKRLDAGDEQNAVRALEQNESVTWTDRETGEQYTVDPTETFSRDGRTCRRYVTTVRIEGEPEEASGTACKTEDGGWEVVS